MMKLRSKYAVTLYEILEAYANRENKTCIASMDEVRAWLKVSEDASSYGEWKDFRRRVIEPAVSEINKHADDAGFTVAYEGVREGSPTQNQVHRDENGRSPPSGVANQSGGEGKDPPPECRKRHWRS